MRMCEWHPTSPAVQVTTKEAQPSLTLFGVLSHELHDRRPELLEEHHRLSEGIKGLWVLLTAADPIKKPTHKPRGMPHLQIPQVAPSTPCSSPKSCGQMHVCTPDGEGKLWQTASEHMPKASSNLQGRKGPQTWVLASLLGKPKGGCQHPASCNTESREGISAIKGSKKHGAGLSNEGLRKPLSP